MKRLLLLIMLCCAALVQAQDTTLPQGICRIQLSSGKVIKNARLWKINNGNLEYLKEESLHDIPTNQVRMICGQSGDYVFADSVLQKRRYDLIILMNNDSIACTIKEVSSLSILYTPAGNAGERMVWRQEVKKYLLKGKEDPKEEALDTSAMVKAGNAIPAKQDMFPKSLDDVNYSLGRNDAKNEFKGNGSLAGGMLCGLVPVLGWIAAPITLAVDPLVDPQKRQLYNSNYAYQAGYKKEVRRKKRNRTLLGFAAGIGTLLLLVAH